MAIEEADVVVFVLDSRSGITPVDVDIAEILRRTRKPLVVVANKSDNARQEVLVFTVNKIAGNAPAEGGLPQMPDVMPSKPPVIPEEPLRAEILSFLQAVRTRETPVISLEDGRRALAVALRIQEAIEEHAQRAHLNALTK